MSPSTTLLYRKLFYRFLRFHSSTTVQPVTQLAVPTVRSTARSARSVRLSVQRGLQTSYTVTYIQYLLLYYMIQLTAVTFASNLSNTLTFKESEQVRCENKLSL